MSVDSLPESIEREAGVPDLLVNFSSQSCFVQLNGRFLNVFVREMLLGKDYHEMDMLFPVIVAYNDSATGFQNDPNMIGVKRIHINMISKEVSRNYGLAWFVAELKTFSGDVFRFRHNGVNILSLVCASRIYTLRFPLLGLKIEDKSMSGSKLALDVSPSKQYNTIVRAMHCHTSKRRAMCPD